MHLNRQKRNSGKIYCFFDDKILLFVVEWKDDSVLWIDEKGD